MGRQFSRSAGLILCAIPAALWAGEIPKTFTLGQYVPDSCSLLFHRAHNPERAYIEQQWDKVYDAVLQSGIGDEVKTLLIGLLNEQERVGFEEQWSQITSVVGGVSWGDLVEREFLVANWLSPVPSHLILCRGAPNSGEKNEAALTKVLQHLATLDDSLSVSQMPKSGCSRSCLAIPGAPFCLEVFRRKDIIGISTCSAVTEEVMSLMAGDCRSKPVIASDRFVHALAELPSPQDSLFFVDFKTLATDLSSLVEGLSPHPVHQLEDSPPQKRVVLSILDRLNVFDYALTVQRTEGLQSRAYSIMTLQPERQHTSFAKVFANRKPLEKPYRFIPAEALDFNVSVGLDFDALYALILDVIKEEVPGGEAALAVWAQTQDNIGFNVQRDVLDWLSGEMISITLPAVRPDIFGSTSAVLMCRVKDPKLAKDKLDAGIVRLNALVRQFYNMELMDMPAATVAAPGFRVLVFPPLAAFAQPVVGVFEDWLIIGGSAETINACLATGTGKAPNILENQRFRKEGILRNDPVTSASFTDLSDLQQKLPQIMALIGGLGGGLSQITDDPDKAKVIKAVMSMIQRLAPVVAQIDFYSSTAEYCTFDGLTWKSELLTTYKAPAGGN